MELHELIQAEELHLKKLNELVVSAVKEELLLSQKLIEIEADKDLRFGERLADRVADFGGSWGFILTFFILLLIWILINVAPFAWTHFDPYPFILLNLILSCLAALQAPVIMMSQNRQEDKDRLRSRSDYMVNLKSEMQIRSLHKKIDLLMAEQMQSLFKIQEAQMKLLGNLKNDLDAIQNPPTHKS